MAHSETSPETMSRVSVDPAEMASFARMAEDWWNPSGMFKPLHVMNGARLGYIKEAVCAHFHRDPDAELPLKGLRVLDIGCGGGLLCEPMTRLMPSKADWILTTATAQSSKWSPQVKRPLILS